MNFSSNIGDGKWVLCMHDYLNLDYSLLNKSPNFTK